MHTFQYNIPDIILLSNLKDIKIKRKIVYRWKGWREISFTWNTRFPIRTNQCVVDAPLLTWHEQRNKSRWVGVQEFERDKTGPYRNTRQAGRDECPPLQPLLVRALSTSIVDGMLINVRPRSKTRRKMKDGEKVLKRILRGGG